MNTQNMNTLLSQNTPHHHHTQKHQNTHQYQSTQRFHHTQKFQPTLRSHHTQKYLLTQFTHTMSTGDPLEDITTVLLTASMHLPRVLRTVMAQNGAPVNQEVRLTVLNLPAATEMPPLPHLHLLI